MRRRIQTIQKNHNISSTSETPKQTPMDEPSSDTGQSDERHKKQKTSR
ncbi:1730_t:CDS:2 [Paraglomus brasilianum]|uniref:1730_t:CDS:1 n=1 Tax=Paraglomus brasilianum TaxID=144538 RepID=A0A9N9BFA3_9GLOM|nr:1730_t:CDS:2 [Paraglomus brasilianum]